jgi:hypothetical protein
LEHPNGDVSNNNDDDDDGDDDDGRDKDEATASFSSDPSTTDGTCECSSTIISFVLLTKKIYIINAKHIT